MSCEHVSTPPALLAVDPLAWVRSLPPVGDPVPPAGSPTVPDRPGWTFHLSPSAAVPAGWRIAARCGSRVIVRDRLTYANVESFDPEAEWRTR